jgi:hypothetical protein
LLWWGKRNFIREELEAKFIEREGIKSLGIKSSLLYRVIQYDDSLI